MICRYTRPPRRVLGMLKAFLLVPILTLAALARGEELASVTLSGESRATALRLGEAQKHLDARKWAEAIEQLQAILNTAGNDLVRLTPTHSIQARQLCRIRLASLPPEGLRLYRQRYETQAGKRLEQALAKQDTDLLRKVVEDAFCTRAAEKALNRLGDLAFERGRFAEAKQWWRLLAPLPDARRDAATRELTLVYPDLTLDPARIQAKQLLARLFHGPESEWTRELDAFHARHGKAKGTLAGRTGHYADLLHTLAQERKKEMQNAECRMQNEKHSPHSAFCILHSAFESDWLTFGGDPSRGRVIAAPDDILDRLSALCRSGPTWRFNLDDHTQQEGPMPSPAVNAAQARSLAFHPVLVGHHVLVADAQYVTAYDLRTGQSEIWCDVGDKNGGVKPNLKLPAPPDLRYTLTVANGNVYARLGAQDIGVEAAAPVPRIGKAAKPRRDNETFLSCLSLHSARKEERFPHLRWSLDGIVPHKEVLFEGAPLVEDGQIWIAATRYNGGRCITSLDCYPTDDRGEPPLRWRRDVCETRELKPGEPRYRHHLLTLAGTQLVYCSHTGAVVAVDARSGRTNWGIRYPRGSRAKDDDVQTAEVNWKDLAPVLFAAGRLYVAPADSDRLLCLDPASGRTLWEREAMKVVHLLGVGQGRLIFSTTKGLRAVGAADGSDAEGWIIPDGGDGRTPGNGLTPAGRGLLIGDLVLFPTTQKRSPVSVETVVYAIRQRDGRPADDPALLHRLPAGNLLYANGCLVVADRHTLSVFVPPGMLLNERKAEARRHPQSIPLLLEQGRAEADAGLTEQAIQTFRQVEKRLQVSAKPSAAKKLLQQAHSERQCALLESARYAVKAEHWEDAATAFRQAAEVPLSARARLHVLTRAAQLWQDAEQSDRAIAVWETILADDALRSIQVIDKHGTPGSAAVYAKSALARLRGERPQANSPPPPRDRPRPGATEVSEPSLPLFRGWHTTLGNDEWILAGWRETDPELLLTGSPEGRLLCRSTSTGETRWQHRLPFVPRWTSCHADIILAGGEQAVACLRREDGELVWHFLAPAAGRYPSAAVDGVRVVVDPQTPEPLTDFQSAAGRLFFLQGQRRLFALDAATGAVLWNRWAPDGGFHWPYPHGCFSPYYYAGSETVLIQMAGRRWLLDAATGRQIHRAADGRELWQRPPLCLDQRTLCVVTDRRHVVLLDAVSGQNVWTHTLTGGTTRSGEMPHVLGRDDLLLLATPTNIGYSLQRLDRATGKPVWPRPHLLTMKTLDASTWAFDRDAVYFVEDRSLAARSLADGRVLWQRSLHGSDAWQVQRRGDYLAVYPIPSALDARLRFRSSFGSVQWILGPALTPESIFTVSCFDPKNGQPIQRLNIRIESPVRTSWERRRTLVDRDQSAILRTSFWLASEMGPVVRLASPQPFVAVGGEVWGLVNRTEVRDAERP
ncbi:MAG TPA: PQQ-binding-like beta-propeller repeat protein [Gemmataceae bacterium]|nr:PQQ-binding-like beta-propeller repeat protein [Gemmataceae bacterium]